MIDTLSIVYRLLPSLWKDNYMCNNQMMTVNTGLTAKIFTPTLEMMILS